MIEMNYDSLSDAQQRLSGMYGLYKNKFCRVLELSGNNNDILLTVSFPRLKGSTREPNIQDSLNSGHFNFNDFQWGYVNLYNTYEDPNPPSAYISRNPSRQSRQGINSTTLYLDANSHFYISRESILREDLTLTLTGSNKFDLEKALYRAELDATTPPNYNSNRFQYAISKNYAFKASSELIDSVILVRRGLPVGEYLGKIRLRDKFSCLEDELAREGVSI
jgi:hypothetical protein